MPSACTAFHKNTKSSALTGGACVYLTVRENVWNFPVGIANSVFFLFLFVGARLYADAALQVVFVALGVQGWYLWLRGCEQIALNAHDGLVNRCLLLTDGLANRGVTNRDELIRRAGSLRERGVQTSTFGVGADFDERLLLSAGANRLAAFVERSPRLLLFGCTAERGVMRLSTLV